MSAFGCFLSMATVDHSAPAGCKLTFERQGEGWWSLSSGDLVSVCKHRAWADGGKLAPALEPYGAYAYGGVCKDPGHGVQAEDLRLLRLAQDTGTNTGTCKRVTVSLNFSWKAQKQTATYPTRQQNPVIFIDAGTKGSILLVLNHVYCLMRLQLLKKIQPHFRWVFGGGTWND